MSSVIILPTYTVLQVLQIVDTARAQLALKLMLVVALRWHATIAHKESIMS